MKIAIDCGHGCFPDTGENTIYGDEDKLTAKLGQTLKVALSNHEVIFTRPAKCDSTLDSLQKRVAKANKNKADLFISLHFNVATGNAQGSEIYTITSDNKTKTLAETILRNFQQVGYKNRGVKDNPVFYVLQNTKMPALLIQVCFLDNKEDMEKYDSTVISNAIVSAIDGIQFEETQQSKEITLSLLFKVDSYLKSSKKQSIELNELEKKAVREKDKVDILSFTEEENHLKVTLIDNTIWYVFKDHVTLLKNGKILEYAPKASSNNLNRTSPEPDYVNKGFDYITFPEGITANGKSKVYRSASIIPNGNFTWAEATHNGERIPQKQSHVDNIIELAKRLEDVRKILGDYEIVVTSWYRPEPWNSQVGGAPQSQHLTGLAADIYCINNRGNKVYTGKEMAAKLKDWEGGLGTYPNMPDFIHIDIRPYKARWN